MKITVSLLMILALILAFGLAYAYESMPGGADMNGKINEAGLYNGITVFDTGPAPDCSSISGVGAGGLGAEEASPVLENGITSFDLSMTGARGSCAGGTEEPSAVVNNGITIFDSSKY